MATARITLSHTRTTPNQQISGTVLWSGGDTGFERSEVIVSAGRVVYFQRVTAGFYSFIWQMPSGDDPLSVTVTIPANSVDEGNPETIATVQYQGRPRPAIESLGEQIIPHRQPNYQLTIRTTLSPDDAEVIGLMEGFYFYWDDTNKTVVIKSPLVERLATSAIWQIILIKNGERFEYTVTYSVIEGAPIIVSPDKIVFYKDIDYNEHPVTIPIRNTPAQVTTKSKLISIKSNPSATEVSGIDFVGNLPTDEKFVERTGNIDIEAVYGYDLTTTKAEIPYEIRDEFIGFYVLSDDSATGVDQTEIVYLSEVDNGETSTLVRRNIIEDAAAATWAGFTKIGSHFLTMSKGGSSTPTSFRLINQSDFTTYKDFNGPTQVAPYADNELCAAAALAEIYVLSHPLNQNVIIKRISFNDSNDESRWLTAVLSPISTGGTIFTGMAWDSADSTLWILGNGRNGGIYGLDRSGRTLKYQFQLPGSGFGYGLAVKGDNLYYGVRGNNTTPRDAEIRVISKNTTRNTSATLIKTMTMPLLMSFQGIAF